MNECSTELFWDKRTWHLRTGGKCQWRLLSAFLSSSKMVRRVLCKYNAWFCLLYMLDNFLHLTCYKT